jgi:hypothetical protein
MTSKQYISSDGQFTSTIADLEQYSETLGEGRYFYYVLSHPEKTCPLRNWYLRIFPEMMKKEGLTIPDAGENLTCTCGYSVVGHTPRMLKDAPDETLWAIIKEECPNYFTKEGKPNGMATRLFDLFRADLLGLIADYAVTPVSDVYIELDTGDVLAEQAYAEQHGFVPNVFLEVDVLEKALTQRAVLRATAAKILRQIGFQNVIKEELGEVRLTDMERDDILRLVYNPPDIGGLKFDPDTNWFGFLHMVKGQVPQYVRNIKAGGKKVKEREREQLARATEKAQQVFAGLANGDIQPINQYTEPEIDVPMDSHAQIMQAILKNPHKQELFMIWVEAERRANEDNQDDTDRLNMNRLYSILTPIFTDPDFEVDEAKFAEYMTEAETLGLFNTAVESSTTDTHYSTNVSKAVEAFHQFSKNHQPDCEWYEHFMHHIDEKTGEEFDCDHVMPCKCKLALMEKQQKVVETPEA